MKTRETLSIRFPTELLEGARQVRGERESLNDLVVEAVQREVRRRRGLEAYHQILRVRAAIEADTGVQPNSSSLVRSLRDGADRHG